MAGPNTRTTQVFINFRDNSNLDSQGFAAFGEVIEGMDVVDTIYGGYGDMQEMGGHAIAGQDRERRQRLSRHVLPAVGQDQDSGGCHGTFPKRYGST